MKRTLPDNARIKVGKSVGGILATAQAKGDKQPFRKIVRANPIVSRYGMLLIVGALLVTLGWEFFRLIIILWTLD
ncbi:alpha-beta hydrolase superfamily lysophospholipase [Bradyrhizobium japonicum]|jgi:hypothetical protein|uniref:hypothetical protein n=1 Tax=Bradyrhizobium TaxID=374 RepID=UPI0004892607|nr:MULTISPECIES: hypothetical protein [Bradyrhizobium]MBR0883019.1 hypothetical protein [Bradyrhizobium liaoningense]MBR0947827.1 hypothetical protein [Bradyrhizobium liaoningense]MBR1003139.1 hypothetical protein [Bradyrhizobium liaoningense]MBR1033683.1 hypothetical protein [Bradyrhizobium liaoningense]MBR1067571.1 hypothetical protein [Bradyrhizobium liaoningense]